MTDTTNRCSICNHPESEAISGEILAGVELRAIAARWDGSISTSALSRHAQRHLAPALRDAAQGTPAAPVDLLQRMVDLADDARAARIRARDTGTPSAQTRSADLEVKVLQALLGQYGIDSGATVAAMADAEKLVKSVARYATEHPAAAPDLIGVIRSQDLTDFADQLEAVVSRKSIERN